MSLPSPTSASVPPSASKGQRHWGVTFLWSAPALFLVFVMLYGILTRQTDNVGDGPQVGMALTDFTLSDLQGHAVRLSDLRGQVVFINVWATWCPPCIEEMPTIQRLYDMLHERGLEVLAVSLDALGKQVIVPFVREHQLSFPVLLDTQSMLERLYQTGGVPESFIVDKQGRLVEKIVGPRDWAHPNVIAMFERLLAVPMPGVESQG
ncbi:MAG: TlpA disulfide reductase family protein [bacterium]|nr:TlpA disulfide reductase family protein [bacterium]